MLRGPAEENQKAPMGIKIAYVGRKNQKPLNHKKNVKQRGRKFTKRSIDIAPVVRYSCRTAEGNNDILETAPCANEKRADHSSKSACPQYYTKQRFHEYSVGSLVPPPPYCPPKDAPELAQKRLRSQPCD